MQDKSWQETVLYGSREAVSSQELPAISLSPPRSRAQLPVLVLDEGDAGERQDLRDVTWLEVDDSWYSQQAEVSLISEAVDRVETQLEPGVEFSLPALGAAVSIEVEAPAARMAPTSDATIQGRNTVFPTLKKEGQKIRIALEDKARYEVQGDLGEGGAGDVLLAKDNDIQRMVALKRLKKKWHTPPTLSRFMEEVRMMGSLEHPNIVPIHDVGLDANGQFYFVMKYVNGHTMSEWIERLAAGDPEAHERFPYEVRNQIFLKILQAVQFAHSQGIIHRDLKPSNIMIGPYGEVMVMDWGLAKQVAPDGSVAPLFPGGQVAEVAAEGVRATDGRPQRWFETRHDSLLGTPAYMAPEQALGRNQDVDMRSDIYSLSALYYEWIGLQHYMSHKESLQELLFGIVAEQPTLLAFVKHPSQPNIPVELCHFVRKGMEKSPAQRFQDLEEMIDGLQKAMSGNFEIQCPVTFQKRLTHGWLRVTDKHPFGALLALFLGLSLMVSGAVQLALLLL